MSAINWGRLLLLSFLWGGTYMMAAIALQGWPAGSGNGVPPLTLVWARVLVAASTLFIALRLMGATLPRGREAWIAFFGMGILNNVLPFSLIFWGQSQLPASVAAGLASILNATTPLFTVVVMHLFTSDERATPLKAVGVVLGIAGVAVMIGLDVASGIGGSVAGQLACLLAALIYAISGLYGRRFKAMGITPLQTALGQLTASTMMMSVLIAIFVQPWNAPLPGIVPAAAVVAIGVFSTALAYILFFQILTSAGATSLSLVTFLIPVSAIFLGIVVLGEALKVQHLIGLAFIAAGLAAIDGRLFRR